MAKKEADGQASAMVDRLTVHITTKCYFNTGWLLLQYIKDQ
jgi:hypothetical protein